MKIAALHSYEILFSSKKDGCYHLLLKDHPAKDHFLANIPKNKIIILDTKHISVGDKKLLKIPGFTQNIKGKGIDTFSIHKTSSFELERWAKTHAIKLLTPSWQLQKNLENKIFFEKLMRKFDVPTPPGIIAKNKKELNSIKKFPTVIQIPYSNGGRGTFFINNKQSLNKLKVKFPLLCRDFIDGLPLGVTLIIGKNSSIFSALRLQAIDLYSKNTNKYFGIQWVKTSHFSKTLIKNLNQILQKLAQALRSINYHGLANVDLMIKGNNAYLIECNPRFALSNLQLSHKKELLHGLDFISEFFKATSGKKLSKNLTKIPNTIYEGATLDLDYLGSNFYKRKVEKNCPVGFYKLTKNGLKYVSNKLSNFSNKEYLFIDHSFKKNDQLNVDSDFGFAIKHKPLFNIAKSLSLNQQGKKIKQALEKLIKDQLK